LIIKQTHSLEPDTICQEHGCPMIAVERDGVEESACLLEVVYELLGGQRVTWVKVSSDKIRLIRFENGYQIEPLCACCGKPTIEEYGVLKNKVLVHVAWETEDYGEDYPELALHFARDLQGEVTEIVPMHIDSLLSLCQVGAK